MEKKRRWKFGGKVSNKPFTLIAERSDLPGKVDIIRDTVSIRRNGEQQIALLQYRDEMGITRDEAERILKSSD